MGSIFTGIGNIVIVKPSPSSYSYSMRETTAAKEAHIDLWEMRGEDRTEEKRRGDIVRD